MLVIYKGYEKEYLEKEIKGSLIANKVEEKINILATKKEVAKNVIAQFTANAEELKNNDKWITYEEFSVCYKTIVGLSEIYEIEIKVIENNKYYNVYHLDYYDKEKLNKLIEMQNLENTQESENEIYSYVYNINGEYYVQYNNYEYDYRKKIKIEKRYDIKDLRISKSSDVDYIFEITNNIEIYLENIVECVKYKKIGIILNIENNETTEMYNGLVGFLSENNYEVYKYEDIDKAKERHEIYLEIAKNEIGIPNFEKFKTLEIYKNPLEGNETEEISQETIINEIVEQIEKSKSDKEDNNSFYRDIFVTAPTGAGKSVMFQIPAVYAAKKYGSLTIVISPLVELMNDQVENLVKRGYYRAARLNSDVNPFDKTEILKKINDGEIDILYLSPEVLLSYSIDTIIGTRDISTIIVDEAHIVTTWGQGFRPDYWYLGTYIEKLRRFRYKNGVLDLNSRKYKFPICTFTATAVFGGKDDGVNEMAESLYLRDPIKFIGKVKRNDISFDINKNNDELNATETSVRKTQDLKEKIKKWQNNNEKSLIYFPYNTTAIQAYKTDDIFTGLFDEKDRQKIGIYTGQVSKTIKKDSAIKFKSGEINTMFATKAFGMGIDIKDIKHVYHYAEAGNLNDYVQEIGRAARDERIQGIAHMDYYLKDRNYAKILFGMSAIRDFHVEGCIRVLNNIYNRTHRRNNLITPQAFEIVFPKNSDLDSTVKTALLNIEKDLNLKYKIPVIITRPRAMFTSAFIVIAPEIEKEILSSEYGKYLKIESKGRNREKESNYIVSDIGDIYSIDLKRMWEDMFDRMSFASFKYQFYSEKEKILGKFSQFIYPRMKVAIQMIDEEKNFVGIRDKILDNINKVSDILSGFQSQQGEFTMIQFKQKLNQVFKNSVIAENIANGYFRCIEDNENSFYSKPFYITKRIGDVIKYRIVNTSYRQKAETLVYKSQIINELNNLNVNKIEKYKTSDRDKLKNTTKALTLLSMFDIIQYDMYGGQNPEIFIRINDPARIKAIAEKSIVYKNNIVKKAIEKHNRDIEILEKFIMELNTDEERWNYIEDYFLGKDVLKK